MLLAGSAGSEEEVVVRAAAAAAVGAAEVRAAVAAVAGAELAGTGAPDEEWPPARGCKVEESAVLEGEKKEPPCPPAPATALRCCVDDEAGDEEDML